MHSIVGFHRKVVDRIDVLNPGDVGEVGNFAQRRSVADDSLEVCRSLTDTERTTFEAACKNGYYETPRETTLEELAAQFDVSKTAVSMNLQRGERKVLTAALSALENLEDAETC